MPKVPCLLDVMFSLDSRRTLLSQPRTNLQVPRGIEDASDDTFTGVVALLAG